MTCVQTSLLLLLALSSIKYYVQSNKVCNYWDTSCTTKGAQKSLKSMLDGIEGLFGPLDPIFMAKIEGEYLSSKYKASNITLSGIKQCLYPLLRLNPDKFYYVNKFRCPKLVLKFDFDIKGLLGPVELHGKGFATVTLNDYIIVLKGVYEEFISKKDNKLHFILVNYNLECECIGPVTIDIDGPLHSNDEKDVQAREFVTKNGKDIETIMQYTMMPSLIGELVKAIDIFLREVPVENILSVDE